jgi:16S rRNA processing protein RimM
VADVKVTVGRIGRAHGVRGEVTVDVRTDVPDERFATGVVLLTDPAALGPLTVRRSRWHSGRLLVLFDTISDRTAAEELRGTYVLTSIDPHERLEDPDQFYDHQLIGMRVVTVDGRNVGTVGDVQHTAAQDLLTVKQDIGSEVFVPFVAQIVPDVDLDSGTIVINPPPGLLDLGQPQPNENDES